MKKIFYIKNNLLVYLLLGLLFSLGGCKKLLQADLSNSAITSTQVFTSDATALSAVDGIYAYMALFTGPQYLTDDGIGAITSIGADDLLDYTQTYADYQTNTISSSGTLSPVYNVWRNGYKDIYLTNAAIEGISASSAISAAVKSQLLGECYVIRAFNYFYLTNLYGDLPLTTSTTYQQNSTQGKAPADEVYKQIIADLQLAETMLPATYPSADRARPNKYTAAALLAKVYLYNKQWALAEAQASTVIQSGLYTLVQNTDNVFLKTSTETIWQLAPVGSKNNTNSYLQYTPTATNGPTFTLTTGLLSSFEVNPVTNTPDKRRGSWIGSIVYNTNTYYYPAKYKAKSSAANVEDNILFRMAEQYLIRAEARAQQNNADGAIADLNIIRNRAGLGNTTAVLQADLLAAISRENRIEYFAEWGHRWFDLKRTGTIDAVLGAAKTTYKPFAKLWPLPQTEILANPNLIQNTGYN
ncbi:RagB/SusD family nutrient uptake outer membrane protein [Mucilaginibacter paludis]|uniref:RagB/SusD domain-containing protein n=1 Tax=Mucilaginibacter paludis DSM 18603 TaxID=714943 RepID=H1YE27_9SPHI|nr:RagB/SusD family nutrient uptake outer membrane protein [Mucilaginibacter paludis]EHQ25205.1 RagB/SusD domain-containing protein [Mucilaginibacter paludis DSM 18603]